ncbi:hypothetical protein [Dyella sp.]|uniref:hypothetical protein n=1 Tax=Dyella sp. TaxID=1869338 RepID=UPI002850E59F|nr:hypothetical protein [Dyella sp.]MDR3444719.1 hypothetical protein [Dyella sp.]
MSTATHYWEKLAAAHATQAEAHRLYAEAARLSGRSDETTLATISHNDVQSGYFAKRATEARSNAAWPSTFATACMES